MDENEKLTEVEIFAHGECSGNPGRGGWCAVLWAHGKEMIVSGEEAKTNFEKMVLCAIVNGLAALKFRCKVHLVVNSQFVCELIRENRAETWRQNKWIKSTGLPVSDVELWKILLMYTILHDVTVEYSDKYKGQPGNVKAHKIAKAISEGQKIDV